MFFSIARVIFPPPLRGIAVQAPAATRWSREQRAAAIGAARVALLRGDLDRAEMILDAVPAMAQRRDAEYLNLRGVLHEARQQWKLARRCYGRAMRIDRAFTPAEQNLRRWYELATFGSTRLAAAI